MRSIGFTLILVLLTLLACGAAAWRWMGGNLETVLGVPPTPVGKLLYSHFVPSDVTRIRISQNGQSADFERTESGWQCTAPWKDRMDPRAAVGIINFTLGMRVEDVSERDKIDEEKVGLRANGIDIRLEDRDGKQLVRYKLGRVTPWQATIPDIEKPVPTIYVHPRDENRKGYIYSCAGDITSIFQDGFKFMRDHRPLYFNPLTLQKILIRADQGKFTLARETPQSPWRIVSPGDLPTDPDAMKTLLEGLYELQASKVYDRAAVTSVAGAPSAKSTQIIFTSFGSEEETVLDISPPESPEATEVKATVSDRPNTVFDLPLKPAPNLVTLANLPLSISGLRDTKLTNLNIRGVEGIIVQSSNSPDILISRALRRPWMVTIEGKTQEANEERLFALLKTMTEGRAIGFESDVATDLSPWGLNQPFMKVIFTGKEQGSGIEIAFGTDGKGQFFANRTGSLTVMKVDSTIVDAIPRRPYEWRESRVWSVDRLNLLAIGRREGNDPPINLLYNFNTEEWTANQDTKDITTRLIASRANFMLTTLEGLKATRWLSPNDASAAQALISPSLIFKVVENEVDDIGDVVGRKTRDLYLAPGSSVPNPAFYYGRLASDPQPFLLDRTTYEKLATDFLEKE